MSTLDNRKTRRYIKKSLTLEANSFQDICETLRLVYDEVYKIDDQKLKEIITERLIDAMFMGKRMAARLDYYKKTYNDTTGAQGNSIKPLVGVNERKKIREERP